MGVIYYKREADYDGDKTVNRSLHCEEVDGNFHFLRGYDISGITFDQKTDTLELHRVDGSVLRVNIGKPVNLNGASLDKRTGVLTLDTDEGPITVSGFLTNENAINGIKVATDSTISGDGTTNNPLRVSATEKTGTFAAADEYRDLSIENKTLTEEDAEGLGTGYRIVTKEKASELGALYSFEEAKEIKAMLADKASAWRIPTKHDWDNILNALEPEPDCDDNYRNHDDRRSNVQLGHVAGKKLKSARFWDGESGLDGFNIIPAGYINEDGGESSPKKFAAFWTTTEEDDKEDMFIKRFESGKDTVYQSTWDPNKKLAIRLVKDFNCGGNCNESEYIDALGITVPCVQMEGVSGATIWTACNIQLKNPSGCTASTWSEFTPEEMGYFERDIYLINEWDGEKWIKREMVDGQSIVLRNFNDPEQGEVHYHEYIVYKISDGVYGLKDTVELLKDEFKDELDEILEKVDEVSESVSALTEDLSAETERALSAETGLHAEIVEEGRRATEAEEVLDGKIESEIDRAVSAETALGEAIIEETDRASSAETALENAIQDEIDRAISAETGLSNAIETEHTRAENAETGLRDDLTALDEKVDAIIASSSTEVAQLRTDLNEEIARSIGEDERLDNAILLEQARAEAVEESLNDEIAKIKASAGLDSEGNYVPNTNANYISSATTLAGADNILDAALKSEELARKGIHIVKISDSLPATVKEAYDLVDANGSVIENSQRILIYKDSSLIRVYLGTMGDELVDRYHPEVVPGTGDAALCFIYQYDDGEYELVKINVKTFLQESEFKDGLSVDDENHIVKVKIDSTSEPYLTVSENGVKLSGVQNAINSAVASEATRATSAETDLRTYVNTKVAEEYNRAHGVEDTLSAQTSAETTRATAAETALGSRIDNEQTRATSAETELSAQTVAETARATTAEAALSAQTVAETTRATSAEGALRSDLLALSGDVQTLDSSLTALTNKVNVIDGNESTEGSFRKADKDMKDSILGDVTTPYNSLEKLQDKIIENKVVAGDNSINVVVNENTEVSVKINPNSNALSLTNTGLLSKLNLTYADDKISLVANDAVVAEINTSGFTKDKLIKSVEVVTVTEPGSPIPAPYIKIVWKTTQGDEITRIPLDSLIDVYTAGNGLKLENNVFSVKIAATSEPYLSADENGLKVQGIDNAIASALTDVRHDVSANTQAINVLNGAYNENGSVKKSVIEAPIGSVVTTITPEAAADQSLLRIIDGTGRFYASNSSNDVKYGQMTVTAALNTLSADTADSKQRIQTLEQKIATAETRIAALEQGLATAETRITALENTIGTLINGDVLNNKIKDVVLRLLEGYPKQIELKKYDAHNNETSVVSETERLQIKFAHDAEFIADI